MPHLKYMYNYCLTLIKKLFNIKEVHDESTQVNEHDFYDLNKGIISNCKKFPDYDQFRREPEPECGFQCIYSITEEDNEEEEANKHQDSK